MPAISAQAVFRTETDSPVRSDFVDREVDAGQYRRIRRYAVPFVQDDDIAANDLASRNAFLLPVPDDKGARARQIAQRIERPLGLALLVQRDAHDHEDEPEQHERFLHVAQKQIDRAAADEEQEHRLAHDARGDGEDAAPLRGRKLVVSVAPEPPDSFLFCKTAY